MTLYEIDTRIAECIDRETGEVIDVDRLSGLVMERDTKLENVALWIKNLDATAKAIKAERDVLKQRQEQAERKSDLLREWLSRALNGKKITGAKIVERQNIQIK